MDATAPARNIKLVVAYEGTAYHGWQRQADGLATVQGSIEAAAARLLGHPVVVNGASRTDAGVHAAGQCANLITTNLAIPLQTVRRGLNSRCPSDIGVLSAEEAAADFHPSRCAKGKCYRYRIHVGAAKPVGRCRRVYHYPRALDADRMRAAGERLVGTRDFRALASAGERRARTVRTVTRCEVVERGDELHLTVAGDGFLYRMVRNIAGTLIEIGRRRWAPERIDEILRSGDRRQAGFTAPAGGLCLISVDY